MAGKCEMWKQQHDETEDERRNSDSRIRRVTTE